MTFIVCIGVYCLKSFLCRPAIPMHQPYSLVSSQHAMLDDDVEVAPIYRSGGMVEKSVRPCEIMTYTWNRRLQCQRVIGSIWFGQKQFFQMDHWPPNQNQGNGIRMND